MSVKGAARPTKADVARLANVSTATVTYVLNDVQGQTISAQTQAAVHAAAKELGCRPNLAARNLAVGASGVMLYIVPRIALGELPLEVGSRLTAALARHGVVLSMQFETDDGQNVVDAVADLNPIAVTSVFPAQWSGAGGRHRGGHPADSARQCAIARDGSASSDDR
jgi:DNA-binding LacI/PurR family transcriptional regulator